MTRILFSFHLSSSNPLMLKIWVISCLHHGIFVTPPHKCICFLDHYQNHLDDLLCPFYCMMHVDPPPVFARDLQVFPDGPMLFCALQKNSGGIEGHNGFISWIISCWAAILWKREMFHDLSEVNLGLDISDVTSWKDSRSMTLANE